MPDLYETELTQSPKEFAQLLEIVRDENVRSFLEIGSRYGGSLWRIANAMPVGSRIVSIDPDIGQGSGKRGARDSLISCVRRLKARGYDAHHIDSDSTSGATVARAEGLGPFDMVFIDGDHEEHFVRADWQNYGPMGRIIAFHDACWKHPGKPCKPVDVPKVWEELKPQYKSETFYDPDFNYGIGVLWR